MSKSRGFGGILAIFATLVALMWSLPKESSLEFMDYLMSTGVLGDMQKSLWMSWYGFVLRMAPLDEVAVMNWGLGPPFNACNHGSAEATQANLYLTLAGLAKLDGTVLEVGSGRGGGASIVAQCVCPTKYIGLDLQAGQVSEANKHFGREGSCPLSFIAGDAENLPLPGNSIDAVLSVETSHTYPHFDKFVREVYRVLRPGGTFHITDFRDPLDAKTMVRDIALEFGEPHFFEDISARVAAALEQDTGLDGARRKLASSLCPSFLMHACLQFIGADAMTRLRAGTKTYQMALFKKNSSDVAVRAASVEASSEKVEQPAELVDFFWCGYAYLAVYIVTVLWCSSLERWQGLPTPKRPLSDYAVILLNIFMVFCNVVLLCHSVRDNPTGGALNFLGFFAMFDVLLYSAHRFILHKFRWCYKTFHSWHHRRNGECVCALDLFFMHPVDCMVQFLIPIDVSFLVAGLDTQSALLCGCGAVFFNTLAHSRVAAEDHLDHHANEHVSFGIGIFMDKLFGTSNLTYSRLVLTWLSILLIHYVFQAVGLYVVSIPLVYLLWLTLTSSKPTSKKEA